MKILHVIFEVFKDMEFASEHDLNMSFALINLSEDEDMGDDYNESFLSNTSFTFV